MQNTQARRKCDALKAQIMAEHWTCRKLIKETGVSMAFAVKYLQECAQQVREQQSGLIVKSHNKLAQVARKVRDADIAHVERHLKLVDRVTRQLERADDICPKDLATLTGLRAQHYKHVEALTGLDVLKQIAVRAATPKDGEMIAWDGVEALDAGALDVLALPASAAHDSDDLF